MPTRGHLRSASAGVGRSQKATLRARIGKRTFAGQGWRPAHRYARRRERSSPLLIIAKIDNSDPTGPCGR
jgi:hypothetical protein